MKVAIPSHSGKVDDHFGHCEYFQVFTTNNSKEIIHEELLASPNGCGCKSNIVEKLSEIGVKVMLAGNIGGGAVNKLSEHGIAVVRGCSGDVKTVLSEWLNGNIKDNGEMCKEHEHHHEDGQQHQHQHRHGDDCD
ncbi:MAG: NifB/NifX family molybdenum-iron cluster-binding protein [Ignavibacteriae bacterium]|nr:NifB/NifX family molybdenum-iron cluster-binding protein [Ignavibacteriota bacterium]